MTNIPRLNLLGRQAPFVQQPYIPDRKEMVYQRNNYAQEYQRQPTQQQFNEQYDNNQQNQRQNQRGIMNNTPQNQDQNDPLHPYYYKQDRQFMVQKDIPNQFEVIAPVINFHPPHDLSFDAKEFNINEPVDHDGRLISYKQTEQSKRVKADYTQYIQGQLEQLSSIHIPRMINSHDQEDRSHLRQQWEIREIYQQIQATFDQKGNISFDNLQSGINHRIDIQDRNKVSPANKQTFVEN